MNLINSILSVVSAIGLLLVAAIMYRDGRHGTYRWFFSYLLFTAFKTLALLPFRAPDSYFYFYAFYVADAISIGLSFMALYEICAQVLSVGTLPFSRQKFAQLLVVLLVVAAGISFSFALIDDDLLVRSIFIFKQTVRIVQLEFLALMAGVSYFYGFSWKRQAFAIAAGFALFASVDLSSTAVRAFLGVITASHFSLAVSLAYFLSVLIWFVATLKGEAKEESTQLNPKEVSYWLDAAERSTR